MSEMIDLRLSPAEVRNILAAYDELGNRSSFFRFNEETQAIIDRLRAALPADTVGLAVVPIEPTEKMIDAGSNATTYTLGGDVRLIWLAMVAAAPSAQPL